MDIKEIDGLNSEEINKLYDSIIETESRVYQADCCCGGAESAAPILWSDALNKR